MRYFKNMMDKLLIREIKQKNEELDNISFLLGIAEKTIQGLSAELDELKGGRPTITRLTDLETMWTTGVYEDGKVEFNEILETVILPPVDYKKDAEDFLDQCDKEWELRKNG